MNKVIMMGRLTHEPELKSTVNGVSVCGFRIAVDRNFQKQDEEKKTDFFNVTAWRSTAEFVAKYFGKGRLILIEGELQTRQYTDRNGRQSTWYEIVADRVYFTGERKETGAEMSSESGQPEASPIPPQECAVDDYPF